MSPAKFPASKRLGQRGVGEVLRKGSRSASAHFELRQRHSMHGIGQTGARLAISVPKRLLRHAVQRNSVKRLVREVFRCSAISSLAIDLLVIYRSKAQPCARDTRGALRAELAVQFANILARATRNASSKPDIQGG